MKKSLFIGALVLLVAAGCNSSNSQNSDTGNVSAIKGDAELTNQNNQNSRQLNETEAKVVDGKFVSDALGFEFTFVDLAFDSDESYHSPETKVYYFNFADPTPPESGADFPLGGNITVESTTQTLEDIKDELENEGDVDNLKPIVVDGVQGIYYEIASIGDPKAIDFVQNGRRFTLSDALTETEQIKFKFTK